MLKIDSHHHFWHYDEAAYGGMNEDMGAIRRDFLPQDLRAEIALAGIDSVITVQARQTLEETRWLLQLAAQNDFVRGVVGWVPLIDANVQQILDAFTAHPKLLAVRHVLHDEPDPYYLLREDFNRGIRALKSSGLPYDILIFERHLPQTFEFVDRHPQQVFVLDHIAKPRIKDNQLSPWKENLAELARRPHVYCKLSGVVTEANCRDWTPAQLEPYLAAALSAFTPQRLMFGSDWPVCLVAAQYKQWADLVAQFTSSLSPDEQARIWSGTAIEAYRL